MDKPATILIASLQGEITSVLVDGLNLMPATGDISLFDIVENSSQSKARQLLQQVEEGGFALNWDLLLSDNRGTYLYLVTAVNHHDQLTITISSAQEDDRILSEMTQINNELSSLQREVSRKHALLETLNSELERSNQDLQQFAYAISHDFREPLRMVRQFMKLLKEKHGPQLNQEGNEFIDFAVDGAERMDSMVTGVLSFSRVETQGKTFTEVDSNEILNQVLASLDAQIDETQAEVSTDYLPIIQADETQIRMIFQNLISNAIKYAGDSKPIIHVRCQETEERFQFEVEDNGIGINEKDHERIFEMFGRLHSHADIEGTGIGLAVVKRIIERHQGQIWVKPAEAGGSIFTFTIPKKNA